MSNYPELYMNVFTDIVNAMADEKGFKKKDFAKKLWPDSSDRVAVDRWQKMRNYDAKTGQPQGVLISDAIRMAQALETDIAMLMLKAELKTKEIIVQSNINNSSK